MVARRLVLGAVALALTCSPVVAAPAATPVTAAVPAPDEDVRRAMLYLDVLVSGLQSPKVDEAMKGTLIGCLYANSLGTIAKSMDKVIADNPGKIDTAKPDQMLGVMARICGYKPAPAARIPSDPVPAPSGSAPVGR